VSRGRHGLVCPGPGHPDPDRPGPGHPGLAWYRACRPRSHAGM